MSNLCPICRSNLCRGGLSFDGFGINACDHYRSRLANFTHPMTSNEHNKAIAKHLGPLFAAAPEMLEALNAIVANFESDPDDLETMDAGVKFARSAIAKATGN